YFFCMRGSRYPSGARARRATAGGYWKSTGTDKGVYCSRGGRLIGTKKTLVFYTGRAPKGEKSGWVMHEYRLDGKLHAAICGLPSKASSKNEWVLCRVFKKSLIAVVSSPPPSTAAA
ncbi:NAC family transcription factor, partial [Escherichia coli]|uniref:NAC family transcription factor n=1 Tax=Escherichia coli TaxID=562 RepID=UPI0018E0DD19